MNNNHPIFSKLDVIYPNPLTADLFNVRMDWNASERSQAFFRYSLDKNQTIAPAATVGMPSNWQSLRNDALQLQAGLTSVVSAKAVNSLPRFLQLSQRPASTGFRRTNAGICLPASASTSRPFWFLTRRSFGSVSRRILRSRVGCALIISLTI